MKFHWSTSVGKPHMTPVSFVNTTKLYEVSVGKPRMAPVSFVKTTKQVEVCQMNHTKCADWVTIREVHWPEQTETGRPNYHIEPDCADSV